MHTDDNELTVFSSRRDAIKRSLGCAGSSTGLSMVDEAVALPLTGSSTVLDYGSDSDATGTNGDSLLRRRSLIRLRESRRRDSITKMCAASRCSRTHSYMKSCPPSWISSGESLMSTCLVNLTMWQ